MDWANIINAIGVIIVAYFTYNQYTKNKVTDYKLKKWKEGAFQMSLTATPMLLVDGIIKLCEKSKNPRINNNFTKIHG